MSSSKNAPVLPEDQASPVALGAKLDGRQRDRGAPPVHQHLVCVDDPLVLDDLPVNGVVGVDGTAFRAAEAPLASAHPEVELKRLDLPVFRSCEPPPLRLGRRLRGEDLGGGGVVAAFDREMGALDQWASSLAK